MLQRQDELGRCLEVWIPRGDEGNEGLAVVGSEVLKLGFDSCHELLAYHRNSQITRGTFRDAFPLAPPARRGRRADQANATLSLDGRGGGGHTSCWDSRCLTSPASP